jgi:acyl-CoA hydrolase
MPTREVCSEKALTGDRQTTSHALLTFVAVDEHGHPRLAQTMVCETDEERARTHAAHERREERLKRRASSM